MPRTKQRVLFFQEVGQKREVVIKIDFYHSLNLQTAKNYKILFKGRKNLAV